MVAVARREAGGRALAQRDSHARTRLPDSRAAANAPSQPPKTGSRCPMRMFLFIWYATSFT